MFQKYRVSVWLKKCDFLKYGIEYVIHAVIEQGKCPAQSESDLINNWELIKNLQALFLFIGLVNFYHQYAPYFYIRMKPLPKFLNIFYRKPIAIMAWTQELVTLFHKLKFGGNYSPVVTIFEPDKPTILNTDWSTEGMV